MRIYPFHQIDSFTNTLFGGNPTAAFLNADSLSDSEMKKIAREMNLSETSFLLTSRKADFRLRYFTPAGNEIKFCGHATVGALAAIAHKALFGCTKTHNSYTLETNAGILDVEIDLTNQKAPHYIFDAPLIDLVPSSYSVEDVAKELGISLDLLDRSKPVMVEKTNNYLYFAARNLECLGKINLNLEKATSFAAKDNTIVFCTLTNEAFDPRNQLHARGYAPLVGVPEDPFTGSMQGGLAAYALSQKMIQPDKWIGVEQGHFMNRPGSVKLEIVQSDPLKVKLHAEAVHVFESKLNLP